MLQDLICLKKNMQTLLKKLSHFRIRLLKFLNLKKMFSILPQSSIIAIQYSLSAETLTYAVSLEGSLKLKEISYIHSEAYAAGELKHGTISLIEDGTLVVALATGKNLFDKTVSNVKEVKARGAVVMGVTTEEHEHMDDVADYTVKSLQRTKCYFPFTYSYSVAVIRLLCCIIKGLRH